MKTNFVKDGVLLTSTLPLLWSTYPAETTEHLISLFEKYEIAYRLDSNR